MENTKIAPLLLAYYGDSVMETMIRRELIIAEGADPALCNKRALEYVTAPNQARAAKTLAPLFDREEQEVFRKAKNARANSVPKNTDLFTYRLATALEAVFAFNSLRGGENRNLFLLKTAYPSLFGEKTVEDGDKL